MALQLSPLSAIAVSVKRRSDEDPRLTTCTYCSSRRPHKRSQQSLSFCVAPQVWDLLSYPYAAVSGKHAMGASMSAESRCGSPDLEGTLPCISLWVSPSVFKVSRIPSNVGFQDHQDRSCCAFSDTSVQLCSPLRGGNPALPCPDIHAMGMTHRQSHCSHQLWQ